MSWRLAKSLETLRAQVNAKWPGRSKDSDGSIGDEHHSARSSDHNPDGGGVVRAIDITHDPRGGFDSYAFADMLLKQQDRRLKYVISNYRIGSGPAGPSPGIWRPYRVPPNLNPHDHHCHISVVPDARGDSTQAWNIDGMAEPDPAAPPFKPPPPTVRKGSHGEYVKLLQSGLGIDPDGDFGPKTDAKLRAFQVAHNLVADGICGPQTWKALNQPEN